MNVTEKMKARSQLKESQVREQTALDKASQQRLRLERFLKHAPAIVTIFSGPDFIFEFVNPLFQQAFPDCAILGKPLQESLPEIERTDFPDNLRKVYESGETYEGKERLSPLIRHNRIPLEPIYYNFFLQALFDEGGKVDGIIMLAYDVSEQVNSRKVIEENASQLKFMANAMPQKVWSAKADGKIDYLNERWIKYTGLSYAELMDWGWKRTIHPDDRQKSEQVWKQSINKGLNFQLEHHIRSKNGEYRWHLTRGLAQRSSGNIIKAWIGTDTDIHDQKMTEQSLQDLTTELTDTNKQLNCINVDLDNLFTQLPMT